MAHVLKKLLTAKASAETLHGRHVAKAELSQVESVIEVVAVPRACAVYDQVWLSRFIRREGSKLFTYAGSVKPETKGTGGGGQYRQAAQSCTLNPDDIDPDSPEEKCAWCGTGDELTICDRCHQWVCSGRMQWKGWRGHKPYFRCRKSCGNAVYVETCYLGFDGLRSTERSPSGPGRKPPQQANAGRTGLPANGNSGALPGGSHGKLLK